MLIKNFEKKTIPFFEKKLVKSWFSIFHTSLKKNCFLTGNNIIKYFFCPEVTLYLLEIKIVHYFSNMPEKIDFKMIKFFFISNENSKKN